MDRSDSGSLLDPEFGPMTDDDAARLNFVRQANEVWSETLSGEENLRNKGGIPSKAIMLGMMVGAMKRMVMMAKKFPALRALAVHDQLMLIKSCYLDTMILRGAMAYDPTQNAWRVPEPRPTSMGAPNDDSTDNMFQQSIRLYTTFKEEHRQDTSTMLLLNMIVLFDPQAPGLVNVEAVKNEQNEYIGCLKKYMFSKMGPDLAQAEYQNVLECLATIRQLNAGARGILNEHADSMDPLLLQLLG